MACKAVAKSEVKLLSILQLITKKNDNTFL